VISWFQTLAFKCNLYRYALVGVNKDSYLILDTLPAEYDSRVKAMEVDEKPTEDYSDIGGLDKQVGLSTPGECQIGYTDII
jgi:ATP-dependent 26S proteasome regulatory subunit